MYLPASLNKSEHFALFFSPKEEKFTNWSTFGAFQSHFTIPFLVVIII